jgi:hypothetical protein
MKNLISVILVTLLIGCASENQHSNLNPVATNAIDHSNDEGKRFGVLLGATIVPRTMTDVLVDQCVIRFPEIEKEGETARSKWQSSNLKLENDARYLVQQMRLDMENRMSKEEALKYVNSLSKEIKTSASFAAERILSTVFTNSPSEVHKTSCLNMFTKIQQGEVMGIKTSQPAAYKIIQNMK